MLAATAATALYLALRAGPRPPLTIVLILLAVLFASAAVGKAVGLGIARLRLRRMLRRIERTETDSIEPT